MNIKLPPDQQSWLEAEVAAGHFASIDEALSVAVADLMAVHNDDLAWAKPFVDQALAAVERGDVISGDDYFKWLDGRRSKLRAP